MPLMILAGVILLWSEGLDPVAAGDFLASIMVPNVNNDRHRVAVLGCQRAWQARQQRTMHLIYEVVEFVGRWSMIDVLLIAVLSALVRMGRFNEYLSGNGALMFALVVIMTMFSAYYV
ncbi:paraquat-inducible protein A [Escherichia coli]